MKKWHGLGKLDGVCLEIWLEWEEGKGRGGVTSNSEGKERKR